MMKLSELLQPFPNPLVTGDREVDVCALKVDSRSVEKGDAFIAVTGVEADGNSYTQNAIDAGAGVIFSERPAPENCTVTWVQLKNTKWALGDLAKQFHSDPSSQLKVVGVTGTNGKTTTVHLLHHIFRMTLRRAGSIGTLGFNDGTTLEEATHTTPGAEKVQEVLARMVDNDCRAAAMEVSSHALDQGRVHGVKFAAGIFTNLTQDHLDYHKTMGNYFNAKKQLFHAMADQEGDRKPAAVINLDDDYGEKLVEEFKDDLFTLTYGCGAHCQVRATAVRFSFTGTQFELRYKEKTFLVRTPLIGHFNVMNSLAALAAAIAVGVRPRDAVKALGDLSQVPGRLQLVDKFNGAAVFVDYAHTPDALTNVCETLKSLEPEHLITVFGCGGDRDKSKRPLMAKAASRGSDRVVATSDNPRSEEPEDILKEVKRGLGATPYEVIVDRYEAIKLAISSAEPGDIVLIAGKGHEGYQEVKGTKHEFDDRHEARRAIMALSEERREH